MISSACNVAAPEREHGAGQQLEDSMQDRPGRRYVVVTQKKRQGVRVDPGGELRIRDQRLELGAEEQRAPGPAVVQGLLADTVARQVQSLVAAIPERDRKHAVGATQGILDAPLLDRREHYLGIGVTAEGDSSLLQLRAKLPVVVDLTVEDDHVALRRRVHRLPAFRRQVDDREAAVS